MKNGPAFPACWNPVSLIPSAICIRMKPAHTHGGVICSTPGRTMPAGELITSLFQTGSLRKFVKPPFSKILWALITALLVWNWIYDNRRISATVHKIGIFQLLYRWKRLSGCNRYFFFFFCLSLVLTLFYQMKF